MKRLLAGPPFLFSFFIRFLFFFFSVGCGEAPVRCGGAERAARKDRVLLAGIGLAHKPAALEMQASVLWSSAGHPTEVALHRRHEPQSPRLAVNQKKKKKKERERERERERATTNRNPSFALENGRKGESRRK
jgi:hypothetical protein